MAVTKIWVVKSRLDQVINYATNEEKTGGFADVIEYATDKEKTEEQLFVSSLNCNTETARQEMTITKKMFGKEDKILAFHGYQSFGIGEVTPSVAHVIGVELANRLWGARFEVLIATHLDKGHIHNHFVLNSVSFVDGKKFYASKATYQEMRDTSDALCKEYALSVVEQPEKKTSYSYEQYMAKQEGKPTWESEIIETLEEVIGNSRTMQQFFEQLKEKGYEWKPEAKYFTLRPPGKERFVRIERRNPTYSLEKIQKRILDAPLEIVEEQKAPINVNYRSYKANEKPKKLKKIGGFRGLYLYYCYVLGVFPKKSQPRQTDLPYALKQDLLKLEQFSEEIRFLGKEQLDTKEALKTYIEDQKGNVEGLVKLRKTLWNKKRSLVERKSQNAVEELAQLETSLQSIKEELPLARKKLKLAKNIEKRSKTMKQNLMLLERKSEKEELAYEHIR